MLTYSAVKRRVSMGSRNLVPAVSPMSGSPTFDTEKTPRKTERGEFITPPRPTAGEVIIGNSGNCATVDLACLHRMKSHICTHIGTRCQNANAANATCTFAMVRIHGQMFQAMSVKRYRMTNVSILHYTSYDFVFQSWPHKNDFQTEHIAYMRFKWLITFVHEFAL